MQYYNVEINSPIVHHEIQAFGAPDGWYRYTGNGYGNVLCFKSGDDGILFTVGKIVFCVMKHKEDRATLIPLRNETNVVINIRPEMN
jgi:hypothetical protein